MSEARRVTGDDVRPLRDAEDEPGGPAPGPGAALERIFERVAAPAALAAVEVPSDPAPAVVRRVPALPAIGRARIVRILGPDSVEVMLQGESVRAALAPEVAPELVEVALREGQSVLLEWQEGEAPLLIGVLQTRLPEEILIQGRRIHLEASEELLMRAGRAAVRLQSDGELELAGSRINAVSRGLFRLVGRMLRLN